MPSSPFARNPALREGVHGSMRRALLEGLRTPLTERSATPSTISSASVSASSPRHADLLLVTGPVTRNMREALERTYAATPSPKWVIASCACAKDGHVFAGSYAIVGGVAEVLPVDLHIPGCPPSPMALLRGLLAVMRGARAR